MSLVSRIKNGLSAALQTRAAEGEPRPGPWTLPVSGGYLPADVGSYMNWWQMGYDPIGGDSASALVEACVSAYAQTIAMCPGNHWVLDDDTGGRERIPASRSALARIFRKPNDYWSISDFLMNMVRSLYADGNAYALALRNDRGEIAELHMMDSKQSHPQLAMTGDIFYHLSGNPVIDYRIGPSIIVPQRDVLHIRLHVSRWNMLKGESPVLSALQDIAASNAMTQQQLAFYMNQARPSAVLTTDQVLNKEDVQFLRDRWDEQSKGLRAGGTPILTAGLKPMFLTQPSTDSKLAEIMKLNEQHVALAFRIPLQILGIGGTPFASTELLMQSWIASGLGFALNHVEEAFGQLFGLKGQPDEYAEFDTGALERSARKDRIDSLARGVQGGILSPNEAREEEGLPRVEFGDEPRVQQQVVPLSAAAAIPAAPAAPGSKPAAPATTATEKDLDNDDRKRVRPIPRLNRILASADSHDRRRVGGA